MMVRVDIQIPPVWVFDYQAIKLTSPPPLHDNPNQDPSWEGSRDWNIFSSWRYYFHLFPLLMEHKEKDSSVHPKPVGWRGNPGRASPQMPGTLGLGPHSTQQGLPKALGKSVSWGLMEPRWMRAEGLSGPWKFLLGCWSIRFVQGN